MDYHVVYDVLRRDLPPGLTGVLRKMLASRAMAFHSRTTSGADSKQRSSSVSRSGLRVGGAFLQGFRASSESIIELRCAQELDRPACNFRRQRSSGDRPSGERVAQEQD